MCVSIFILNVAFLQSSVESDYSSSSHLLNIFICTFSVYIETTLISWLMKSPPLWTLFPSMNMKINEATDSCRYSVFMVIYGGIYPCSLFHKCYYITMEIWIRAFQNACSERQCLSSNISIRRHQRLSLAWMKDRGTLILSYSLSSYGTRSLSNLLRSLIPHTSIIGSQACHTIFLIQALLHVQKSLPSVSQSKSWVWVKWEQRSSMNGSRHFAIFVEELDTFLLIVMCSKHPKCEDSSWQLPLPRYTKYFW